MKHLTTPKYTPCFKLSQTRKTSPWIACMTGFTKQPYNIEQKPIKKNIFLKEAEYMEMQRKVLRGQAYFSSMPGSSIERLSLIKDDYFDNIFHIDSTKNMIPRTKSNEHIGVDEEDEKREKVKGDCIII